MELPFLSSPSPSSTPPHLAQISPPRRAGGSPDRSTSSPPADLVYCFGTAMATSKKEPPNRSRDRATRMSPNLRPSSSESSSGYGARRARSVPSSPDRKFGPSSSSSTAASGSPDMYRPSLSLAGRSVLSRSISSSGSSIHGSRVPGASSKPTLARVKSDKVTAFSQQRPPVIAVTPSSSFKDMANTAAAPKAPLSILQKSKLSPRPRADKATVASPKPSTQRAVAPGAVRGGRTQPVSLAHAPGAAAKKGAEAANGGATAGSRARSAPQRAMGVSATMEKEEVPSMQFEESESTSTPSIEEHLHEQLPDPVNLKSVDMAALASAQPDQEKPYFDHQEQQGKNEEEVKGQFSEDKEDAGGSELHNGGQDADARAKNKPYIVKAADESKEVEKEEAKAKADKVVLVWRKNDPKSNDLIEETKSKLLEERKSRVKALVGAFETVMSFKE